MSTETLTSLREVTLTPDETTLIEHANAILTRVEADDFPWPQRLGRVICLSEDLKGTVAGLRASLGDFNGLRTRDAHPSTVFPDLDGGRDDALEVALRLVAEDIRDWTAALASLADEATVLANSTEGGTR